MNTEIEIATLLERLARVHAAQRRVDGLTDAQSVVLEYLSRANRFSRSPSAVAAYLMTTRGTASQTLKSLAIRGLMVELAPVGDKRSRRYDLTPTGVEQAAQIGSGLGGMNETELKTSLASLRLLLRHTLAASRGRTFGLCQRCRHHVQSGDGQFCALLKLTLLVAEADQLCQEFADPAEHC